MQNSPSGARSTRAGPLPESIKQRILLLAEPELSSALKSWLEKGGFEVCDARQVAVAEPAAQSGSEWLTATLFPCKEESVKTSGPRAWLQHILPKSAAAVVKSIGRRATRLISKPTERERDETATLFKWGEFDAVILQDLWLSTGDDPRLIPLGCVLASDDYYVRGNFSGLKIVLVTDLGFFNTKTPAIAPAVTLASMFDENGQIVFLQLAGDSEGGALPLRQLKNVLTHGRGTNYPVLCLPSGAKDLLNAYRDSLRNRASGVLVKQLRRYISERADVVVVDDDPDTIMALSDCLSCTPTSPKWPTVTAGGALVLSLNSQKGPNFFLNFSTLARHCKELLEEAAKRGRNTLFITDILFDRVQWASNDHRRSGIELIEALREEIQEWRQRIGIVAFTGLSTPFVTTSAYQRGADAVVFKRSDPLAIGHSHVRPSSVGMDRLLLTLAFLCFQKQFLQERRRADSGDPERELEQLMQVLPRHVVSPHVQEEWNDTCYILKGFIAYPADNMPYEFEANRRDIMRKYDDL